jgi:hypothetical protein
MRQPGAAALRRTHQTIKIKEKDAPCRRASGFGSASNNQDWEGDAPDRRVSSIGSALDNQDLGRRCTSPAHPHPDGRIKQPRLERMIRSSTPHPQLTNPRAAPYDETANTVNNRRNMT